MRLKYGGICISGASHILLVGIIMCTQAGEHKEAAFFKSFRCHIELRKVSTTNDNVCIMPGF